MLQTILEQLLDWNLPLYVSIINYKKAFNNMDKPSGNWGVWKKSNTSLDELDFANDMAFISHPHK